MFVVVFVFCFGVILTFARHSWPLSSEGYLACRTYCGTGKPFIMVISEDTWHLHWLPSFFPVYSILSFKQTLFFSLSFFKRKVVILSVWVFLFRACSCTNDGSLSITPWPHEIEMLMHGCHHIYSQILSYRCSSKIGNMIRSVFNFFF